jgi:hypothetical protein
MYINFRNRLQSYNFFAKKGKKNEEICVFDIFFVLLQRKNVGISIKYIIKQLKYTNLK